MDPDYILNWLSWKRFSLEDEKALQREIAVHMEQQFDDLQREYRLDSRNIVDFFIRGIAIEIKIKGKKMAIYKQCERYAAFDEVKKIILLTNKAMGFPEYVNDKRVYVLNLGKAWL